MTFLWCTVCYAAVSLLVFGVMLAVTDATSESSFDIAAIVASVWPAAAVVGLGILIGTIIKRMLGI